MNDRFLGITLGVRAADVVEILQDHGVTGTVRKIAPPASLAFGVSRKRVLDRTSFQTPPFRRSVLVLMGLWGMFGASGSFTVTAFFLTWSPGAQRIGLALSIATASLAIVATATAIHRVRREGRGATLVDSDLAEALTGSAWFWTGTEFDLFLICFLFVLLLFLFVLYVFWLPLLLIAVSLLTFGQLWREFRGTVVVADFAQSRGLGAAGDDLLRRGAVLSKSWDLCLSASSAENSTRGRTSHYLVHRLFLATGVMSLAIAGLAFLDREFPSDAWRYPIAASIGGAVSAVAGLTFIEPRRRLASSAAR